MKNDIPYTQTIPLCDHKDSRIKRKKNKIYIGTYNTHTQHSQTIYNKMFDIKRDIHVILFFFYCVKHDMNEYICLYKLETISFFVFLYVKPFSPFFPRNLKILYFYPNPISMPT